MMTMVPMTPGQQPQRMSAPMGSPAPRPMQPSVMPTMQPQGDLPVSQPAGLSTTSQMLRQPMPLGLHGNGQPAKLGGAPGLGPVQSKGGKGGGGVGGGGKSRAGGAPAFQRPSVMPGRQQF